jgi:hypothetical protein
MSGRVRGVLLQVGAGGAGLVGVGGLVGVRGLVRMGAGGLVQAQVGAGGVVAVLALVRLGIALVRRERRRRLSLALSLSRSLGLASSTLVLLVGVGVGKRATQKIGHCMRPGGWAPRMGGGWGGGRRGIGGRQLQRGRRAGRSEAEAGGAGGVGVGVIRGRDRTEDDASPAWEVGCLPEDGGFRVGGIPGTRSRGGGLGQCGDGGGDGHGERRGRRGTRLWQLAFLLGVRWRQRRGQKTAQGS